jgi:hypothetical protein
LPQTCKQCGDTVQHRLDNIEALLCRSAHLVAPTISKAALVPFRPPEASQQPAAASGKPGFAADPPATKSGCTVSLHCQFVQHERKA